MARLIAALAAVAMTIYALVDCAQSPVHRIRALPKVAWLGLIVVVPVVAPLAWFFAGRPRSSPPRKGNRPSGPRGPEDDPDFLRNL